MNLYFLRYFETINFFLNNLYYYYGKYFIVFDFNKKFIIIDISLNLEYKFHTIDKIYFLICSILQLFSRIINPSFLLN